MTEVVWPNAGSWALAACSALAIAGACIFRRWKKQDAAKERLDAAQAAVEAALATYNSAVRHGTPADARAASRKLEAAQKTLRAARQAFMALCVAMLFAGCAKERVVEKETILRLDEHVRLVQPGDTVPDFPDGETRWWLLTPTGLEEMLPKGE
jgi:hypothetical protein